MEEASVKVFNYGNSPISFKNGETRFVNATEMAKPFGKLASGWLRNQSTQCYINDYCAMRNCIPSDIVKVTNGDEGGTWMHEDIALEFARWLSPKFAIWCNDRIKELMQFGVTATPQAMEQMINNPDAFIAALQALKKEREEKAALAEENKKKQILIDQNQPKVLFASAVESSKNDIYIKDLAIILKQNGLEIGEKRLFALLRKDGYLTLKNVPTQKSMDLGIMKVSEYPYFAGTETRTRITSKITGKGQIYFCNKYIGKI